MAFLVHTQSATQEYLMSSCGATLMLSVDALSLRTIPKIGCSGPDNSGRRWGRITLGSGGLRAHNGEGELLHGAITLKLYMA